MGWMGGGEEAGNFTFFYSHAPKKLERFTDHTDLKFGDPTNSTHPRLASSYSITLLKNGHIALLV